jgi:uncharacterized membrane protein
MKKISKLTVITTLITLLPIALGIALYDRLPEVVATHWNIHNRPDGWSSRAMAVFGIPCIMAALNLVCGGATDRLQSEGVPKRVLALCRWIIPVLSLILVPVMLYSAMGVSFDMGRIVCSILGIMFIIIGNYLPKCRRNGVVGIKIPWTLSSDENWDKTHRFAGFVWIVCGAAAIVGGWTKPVVVIVALVAMILLPVVYSGILKHKGI